MNYAGGVILLLSGHSCSAPENEPRIIKCHHFIRIAGISLIAPGLNSRRHCGRALRSETPAKMRLKILNMPANKMRGL